MILGKGYIKIENPN